VAAAGGHCWMDLGFRAHFICECVLGLWAGYPLY
jgi:hypothetical protein